jgi:hypothetical protein
MPKTRERRQREEYEDLTRVKEGKQENNSGGSLDNS